MGQSFAGIARRNRIVALATAGFMLAGLSASSIASADPDPQAATTTATAQTPAATTASQTPATITAGTPTTTAATAIAQTSPPPGTPSTGGPGGGARTGVTSHTAPFGHLPIIDIIPDFESPYPLFSTAQFQSPLQNPVEGATKNTGTGYSPIDIGGTFKLPILPWLSAAFDRNINGTLNVPNAYVTGAKTVNGQHVSNNAITAQAFSRDIVLVTRLDETPIKRLQIEEGLYFRHRAVGGANTSANPAPATTNSTEAHYGYVGVTYSTPGYAPLLNAFLTFNINADTQAIDHHVSCANDEPTTVVSTNYPSQCINGVWDPNPSQNRVWETDQYVQLTVPFKDGVSFTAQDRWGALNFYENAPFPYRWTTSQTYIFTKRFSQGFAVSLRDKTQWAVAQGAPFVQPNTQHNGAFDVLADFRIDTNHLH